MRNKRALGAMGVGLRALFLPKAGSARGRHGWPRRLAFGRRAVLTWSPKRRKPRTPGSGGRPMGRTKALVGGSGAREDVACGLARPRVGWLGVGAKAMGMWMCKNMQGCNEWGPSSFPPVLFLFVPCALSQPLSTLLSPVSWGLPVKGHAAAQEGTLMIRIGRSRWAWPLGCTGPRLPPFRAAWSHLGSIWPMSRRRPRWRPASRAGHVHTSPAARKGPLNAGEVECLGGRVV